MVDVVDVVSVRVDAFRWSQGWELHVLGQEFLVTQTETGWGDFVDAEVQVRDYLATVFWGADFSKVVFEFVDRGEVA